MNILILSGRIGQDPEAKQTPAGQVVTFSLAETIFSGGEKTTAWHDCHAWGKSGETLLKYAQKGTAITLQGALKYDQYENKDGQKVKRAKIAVFATEITSGWKEGGSLKSDNSQSPAEDSGSDGLPF